MKKSFVTFLLLLLVGCKSSDQGINVPQDNSKGTSLIFGSFAGHTSGRHSWIYMVNDTVLFYDSTDSYSQSSGDNIIFSPIAISKDKFDVAHDLIAKIPQQLKDSNEAVFGCPDCADQGGYFVEIKANQKISKYRIDTYTQGLPQYVRDFASHVDTALSYIWK